MFFEKDEMQFHLLLKSVREYKEITIEQLSKGLCSVSQMHYIENGKRFPDYLMRNRIMARLGVSSEGYEDYIQYDEYEKWCDRQKLILLVEESKWEDAYNTINRLKKEWRQISKIEQQFLLDMNARVLMHEESKEEEIYNIYREIVELTMGDYGDMLNKKVIYAPDEYYYLINLLKYKAKVYIEDVRIIAEELSEVVKSINNSPLEGIAKAKVLPFSVIVYYSLVNYEYLQKNMFWRYTCEAIDSLRQAERSYYLKELVQIRLEVKSKEEYHIDLSLEEEVNNIIERLEDSYESMMPMWQNGYIYRDSRVNSIAEVIHDRRRMLGITRKDLARGICSVRTLERIEACHSKPQNFVMNALFERLNLASGYRRSEIITSDIGLINEFNKYKTEINQKQYARAESTKSNIIKRLDKKYIPNKQTIIRVINILAKSSCDFSVERCKSNLQLALSLSINNDISDSQYYYLTNGEIALLYNIAIQNGIYSWHKKVLDYICNSRKDYYSLYFLIETIRDWEASKLGDEGSYDESDAISREIIKTSLRLCRIHGLYRSIANIAWNKYERNKTNESKEEYNKMITQCILLCDFSHNHMAEVYRKELK